MARGKSAQQVALDALKAAIATDAYTPPSDPLFAGLTDSEVMDLHSHVTQEGLRRGFGKWWWE